MSTVFARSMPRTLISAAIALAGTVTSFTLTVQPVRAAPGGVYSATLSQPLGAARREQARRGAADAGPRARHQDAFSRERAHGVNPAG